MASTVVRRRGEVGTAGVRSTSPDGPTIGVVNEAVVVIIALCAMFLVVKVARVRDRSRKGRAATVDLLVDDVAVQRRLADGREERAVWSEVISVEIVCTPVRTVDGARAFALIACGGESGCLVPLGVGYDDDLVVQLARLPRFRVDEMVAATEHRPPRRTMVWERISAQSR